MSNFIWTPDPLVKAFSNKGSKSPRYSTIKLAFLWPAVSSSKETLSQEFRLREHLEIWVPLVSGVVFVGW
jgi:hypothetical protein